MGNKKSFISFIMMTMLMVSIPVVVSAKEAVPALKLDTSTKYPGDAIQLTGTSLLSDVIVKIVRPDGTVLYYNAVKVTQGTYKDSITLPTDAMLGKYTVVVGQGSADQLPHQTFTVAKKPDGGNGNSSGGSGSSGGSSGSGSSGGTGGNGGNGNEGGTPPITEGAAITVKENGSAITAVLPSSAMNVTKVNENGAALAKVTVDKTILSEAFEALKAKPNESGKALVVGVTVPNLDGAVGAKVELPAGVLKDAQNILPSSLISIQAQGASIELPVKGIHTAELERALSTSATNINIVVTSQTMPALLSEKDKQSMMNEGITKLSDPISFHVAGVANNGKQVRIESLGNSFINKTLSIRSTLNIDSKNATVVAIDPNTRKMRFVPSVFQTTADGATMVHIKDHVATEIYMLVSSKPSFKDTAGHWAQSSIEHMAAKQIVKGVGVSGFNPNGKVTRAEFAAMLVRAAGWKSSSELKLTNFKDVQAGDWFAGAVQVAAERGLVKGMQDGTFQPDAPITREQMAVMIERFMELVDTELQANSETSLNLGERYKDASHISSWAQSSMERLVSSKLMVGLSADKLAPKAQTTRAETVKILERGLRYAKLIN
ncbi:S-layer homology domain-containing protein [Paenibacillus agilis]|uniref:SLH domain-containing protein n=1 Tax=Paenibacillus agilis TaxID=3020863 RepID=A0A559J1U4_9BACL|nr:S-layer homology domain-containing protein [Paenibacillus agilis]TVX93821.1 hypothetical protein FPZ44_12620 [Paenibacillus agilis]